MPPLLPADSAGHLPLPLLRQYAAGTLSAAEQHRIEMHTLSCPHCADVLEGLTVSDAATTDAALTGLRTRLHQRIAQEAEPQTMAIAWRAVAAVVVLLVLSTAAWFGLRPSGKPEQGKEVAITAPAAKESTIAAPKMSAPMAAEVAKDEEVSAEPAAADLPAAPVVVKPSVRRRPLAAKRPVRSVAAVVTTTPAMGKANAGVAMNEADQAAAPAAPAVVSAQAPPPPAPDAARAQAAAVTADTMPAGSMAVAKAKKAERQEEGADRKANLPPAVTISPQPVGGYRALREYLHRENTFVPEPPAKSLEGSVRLKFTVTAAGKLEDFQVVRSIRADYDTEAIRLLCEGPAWQPGVANGHRADQVVEMSVGF